MLELYEVLNGPTLEQNPEKKKTKKKKKKKKNSS